MCFFPAQEVCIFGERAAFAAMFFPFFLLCWRDCTAGTFVCFCALFPTSWDRMMEAQHQAWVCTPSRSINGADPDLDDT